MIFAAVIVGTLTGMIWSVVLNALWTGKVRHRWKLYVRSTHRARYWRRVGVLTFAALLGTCALVMMFVLSKQ